VEPFAFGVRKYIKEKKVLYRSPIDSNLLFVIFYTILQGFIVIEKVSTY